MARPIWTGVISFGLVTVPVGLFSATEDHDVSFHQFEQGTDDRIRNKRVNESTGKEVDYSDIVKGADIGGGHYVMLEQDELESVVPGRSKSLEIDSFVDLDAIDPLHFQKSYYLGPGDGDTAKAYALLRDAMAKEGKVAIGRFVMRGKEYLTAIRADENVLVLMTLFFADEIRDPTTVLDDLPARSSGRGKEVEMASQLISTMSADWRPADYHDTYTERVQKLIDDKRDGVELELGDEAPEPTNVVDLISALRASVDAARGRSSAPTSARSGSGATKKAQAKKASGKKGAARKTPAKKSGSSGRRAS